MMIYEDMGRNDRGIEKNYLEYLKRKYPKRSYYYRNRVTEAFQDNVNKYYVHSDPDEELFDLIDETRDILGMNDKYKS